MNIAVSTDERTPLVKELINELNKRNHNVTYFGPKGSETVDWPVITKQAASLVPRGIVDEAIVMCWTGTGASIAANKIKGVRAALCCDAETAKGARIWNHANVLALSLNTTNNKILKKILDAWFSTPYSADNWNLKQIKHIKNMEK
ncbi:MAG: RpiB/LacA/LacB family sugar-phosphate isomerase [SAR202 cluster bacterium]|nr:RpiB/LacA/LacB family sugar-phosphate isomerase [SAR202 cluster bacterium]